MNNYMDTIKDILATGRDIERKELQLVVDAVCLKLDELYEQGCTDSDIFILKKRLIKLNPVLIKVLDTDNCEVLQLYAIENGNHMLFAYIADDCTEKAKFEAVKKYGHNIAYIQYPSDEMQILAVQQDPENIRYIKLPCYEAVKIVVSNKPEYIAKIKNPSEELQLIAVKQDPILIEKIINPTEKVKSEVRL